MADNTKDEKLFFLDYDDQPNSREKWIESSTPDQPSKFREMSPQFCQSLLDHRHAPELYFSKAICQALVEILGWRGSKTGADSKQFFSLSQTHAVLGYTLLAACFETICQHESSRIGVPFERVLEIMKRAETKSDRTCRTIIDDGADAGHIVKSKWSVDHRKAVLFISPRTVQEWLEHGVVLYFNFLQGTGLSQTLNDLELDQGMQDNEPPHFTQIFLDAYQRDLQELQK